ncbi:hypothetical protein QTP86_024653 [Hemibagrus guttatus]|nr:hypothetical protein QTP86_024653 [Hemibagrus guttatus]
MSLQHVQELAPAPADALWHRHARNRRCLQSLGRNKFPREKVFWEKIGLALDWVSLVCSNVCAGNMKVQSVESYVEFWLRVRIACGREILLSLSVLAFRERKRFPDRNRENSPLLSKVEVLQDLPGLGPAPLAVD